MAWRYREGSLNFIFSCDGTVEDEIWGGRMKMGPIWRIQGNVGKLWHDLPDWIYNASYQYSYLPYWKWSIDLHMTFSLVPVSHDDFPHLLSSLSFSSSTLP